MLLDVVLDSLRFLCRDDLDACQLVSQSIRVFIDGSLTLPMRSIGNVAVVRRHPKIASYDGTLFGDLPPAHSPTFSTRFAIGGEGQRYTKGNF